MNCIYVASLLVETLMDACFERWSVVTMCYMHVSIRIQTR